MEERGRRLAIRSEKLSQLVLTGFEDGTRGPQSKEGGKGKGNIFFSGASRKKG